MVSTKRAGSSQSSSTSAPKSAKSALGAPSQLAQSSRKGKRAWRKNIDLQEVDEGLETLRTEERIIGSTLQKQTDDQLFVVDTKGDEKVRKSLPRYSKAQLWSTKILSQRSAVPAVVSRTTKSQQKVSRVDKERLLRIAKRPRKGPFNAVMDPTEFGAGSAAIDVSYAVKNSGGHDLWAPVVEDVVPDGLETVQQPKIKKPGHSHIRDVIDVPAVSVPHPGASYNPPVQAHKELLLEAFQKEQKRQEEAEKLKEAQRRIEEARSFAAQDIREDAPAGMVAEEIKDDAEVVATALAVVPKKPPPRKTKQQRARMAKQRAERHALAEKATRKRLLNSINQIKSLRSEIAKTVDTRHQVRLARQLALRLKLRKGLGGQRFGKHRVPNNEIEVQIGDDLSENLRNLKPEGNPFRDRFVSLQQRALIEPRVPVLPTRRKAKLKEYEKHAWKRFE